MTSLDFVDINFGVLSEYLDRIKGAFDVVKHMKTMVTDGSIHWVGPLREYQTMVVERGAPVIKPTKKKRDYTKIKFLDIDAEPITDENRSYDNTRTKGWENGNNVIMTS